MTGYVVWNAALLDGTAMPSKRGGPNHDGVRARGRGPRDDPATAFSATAALACASPTHTVHVPALARAPRPRPCPAPATVAPPVTSASSQSTFGNFLLLNYDANGTQTVVRQPTYFTFGHWSRFVRPGAVRVAAGGAGVASTPEEYDAVRAISLGQPWSPPILMLASAFLTPDGLGVVVVVTNPTNGTVAFKLEDAAAGRAVATSIPAHAVQTYQWLK